MADKIGIVHIFEKVPGPSVGTPFLRRWFGDERKREWDETWALYCDLSSRPNPLTPVEIGELVYSEFTGYLTDDLQTPFCLILDETIRGEQYMFECPPPSDGMTLKEFADYRNFLRRRQFYLQNYDQVAGLAVECLSRIFAGIAENLPQTEAPSPFTIPLIYALPEPKLMVDKVYGTLVEPPNVERGLFAAVSGRMYELLCKASGRVPYEEAKKPFRNASDNDATLDEICDLYLKGTPLYGLFTARVPLRFTHHERFEHMHVVGGTGAGKTTLLQNLILHDLQSPDPPALVVIDSQGDLINKLTHLALFEDELADRFVLITPKDIEHPPALNIFDLNRRRLGAYDQLVKEQVVAGAIQTFDYLFSGLLGADLTAKQGVFFKYVARLMLALPEALGRNATILDMLHLMENPAPYGKAIESLPPLQRTFFERDFHTKTFAQTKDQIRYRLQAIIENPTLARLFTSPETKVDLFTELNNGSIILVDTAKDFLKGASSHFGRIFISLVLQAVLERAAIPEWERKPAFLVVDEAAAYFDSNIDDLLTEARKYKLGCVFAHQYLDQCAASLKASLAANTSIKFAGGISTADARHMAPDMRTTAEFVLGQPKLHFACHIRNVTPQAVSIPIPVGVLERQPRLSQGAYERLIRRNRERVSLGQEEVVSPDTSSVPLRADQTAKSMSSGRDDQGVDPAAASEEW